MHTRRLFAGLLTMLLPALLIATAGHRPAAQAAPLATEEIETVKRVEEYLNGIKSLHSRFIQVNSYGAWAEGELYIKRPGNLRFEYDDPHPILMIADGSMLLFYDKSLKQASFVPLSKTPLRFLTSRSIRLTDDAEIVGVDHDLASVGITLKDRRGGFDGTITLVFGDKPLQLRKWLITDEKGVSIEVALVNPLFDVTVNNKLFNYDDLDVYGNREHRQNSR